MSGPITVAYFSVCSPRPSCRLRMPLTRARSCVTRRTSEAWLSATATTSISQLPIVSITDSISGICASSSATSSAGRPATSMPMNSMKSNPALAISATARMRISWCASIRWIRLPTCRAGSPSSLAITRFERRPFCWSRLSIDSSVGSIVDLVQDGDSIVRRSVKHISLKMSIK